MNIEYDVLHTHFKRAIKEMTGLVKEYFNKNTTDNRIEYLERVFFKISDTEDQNHLSYEKLKHTLLYLLNFPITEEDCDRLLHNYNSNIHNSHISIDQFYEILEICIFYIILLVKNSNVSIKGRFYSLCRSFIEQFSLENIEKYMFMKFSSVARKTTFKRFNDANPPLLPCKKCNMAFFTLKQYYRHELSHYYKQNK